MISFDATTKIAMTDVARYREGHPRLKDLTRLLKSKEEGHLTVTQQATLLTSAAKVNGVTVAEILLTHGSLSSVHLGGALNEALLNKNIRFVRLILNQEGITLSADIYETAAETAEKKNLEELAHELRKKVHYHPIATLAPATPGADLADAVHDVPVKSSPPPPPAVHDTPAKELPPPSREMPARIEGVVVTESEDNVFTFEVAASKTAPTPTTTFMGRIGAYVYRRVWGSAEPKASS